MLAVGTLLYGYCNGYFGRNNYATKRIEAFGTDWIVARTLSEDAFPEFAYFDTTDRMLKYIKDWSNEKAKAEWSNPWQ